jgi:hypothetical protein
VFSQVVNDEADDQDADPCCDTADYLGIGRTKRPAQLLPGKITENANSFQAENPAGVKADGEIQVAGAYERKTEHDTEKKEAEYARQESDGI